jgi:hypothetical protein
MAAKAEGIPTGAGEPEGHCTPRHARRTMPLAKTYRPQFEPRRRRKPL